MGKLDQSLFARFIRLGVPHIQLDMQGWPCSYCLSLFAYSLHARVILTCPLGRSRPSLAELYTWRYKALGNLPHVTAESEYLKANAGFRYDYQLINVEDYLVCLSC